MLNEVITNNYELIENELTLINKDFRKLAAFIENEANNLNITILKQVWQHKIDKDEEFTKEPVFDWQYNLKYVFDFTNIAHYKFFTYLILKRFEQIEHLNTCYEVPLCA